MGHFGHLTNTSPALVTSSDKVFEVSYFLLIFI